MNYMRLCRNTQLCSAFTSPYVLCIFFFLLLIFVLCAYFQFLYSCVYFYTSFKPFLLVLCFKVQRIFRRELTFDEGLSDFDSMKEHYFMKCNMLLSTSLA